MISPTTAFDMPGAPSPTVLTTRYDAPDSFGVGAIGGDYHDVMLAIVDQLREWGEAGLLGPRALTDAGTALLDMAQDCEVAA